MRLEFQSECVSTTDITRTRSKGICRIGTYGGGRPTSNNAGKVMKVPPPAIEFSIPPNNPAMNSSTNSIDTAIQNKGIDVDQVNSFRVSLQLMFGLF